MATKRTAKKKTPPKEAAVSAARKKRQSHIMSMFRRRRDPILVPLTPRTVYIGGSGKWLAKGTRKRKLPVTVTAFEMIPSRNNVDKYGNAKSGELRVYFDPHAWKTSRDGLIYSDRGFLENLRKELQATSAEGGSLGPATVKKITYSEQGMQGINFVSFDVSGEVATWNVMWLFLSMKEFPRRVKRLPG